MTNLFRVQPVWTGGPGLPGTNTLYGSEGDVAVTDMRTELEAFYGVWCDNHCSDDITVTIPSTGDIIDHDTGGLVGVWTSGSPIVIPGTQSTERLALADQVLVSLLTDSIFGGRRLRGRIFLPGGTQGANDNGVVDPGVISSMYDAAQTCFVDDFAVYSPTNTEWATVTATSIWDQFAVLRSRRD